MAVLRNKVGMVPLKVRGMVLLKVKAMVLLKDKAMVLPKDMARRKDTAPLKDTTNRVVGMSLMAPLLGLLLKTNKVTAKANSPTTKAANKMSVEKVGTDLLKGINRSGKTPTNRFNILIVKGRRRHCLWASTTWAPRTN